jgi:uncharacterized protein (DUF1697 family)
MMAMRYVAFLRAVNVGGRVVKMPVLKKAFESLRFSNVETFIASGNVVFETAASDVRKIERKIEARLREALGFEVTTFVRSVAEVSAVARLAPFPASALTDGTQIYVGFLSGEPGASERKRLMALANEIDDFHVTTREVWWLCRKDLGSPSGGPPFEKVLGLRVTFRNARTVTRLAAKYCQ